MIAEWFLPGWFLQWIEGWFRSCFGELGYSLEWGKARLRRGDGERTIGGAVGKADGWGRWGNALEDRGIGKKAV